jgi:hypothetical protein
METNDFLQEISLEDAQLINGGFITPISIGIGIVAGLVYCFDFGYNYAKARL